MEAEVAKVFLIQMNNFVKRAANGAFKIWVQSSHLITRRLRILNDDFSRIKFGKNNFV